MSRNYPGVLFERYAGDVICHCKSEAQARQLRAELDARLAACKLQLHPEKTKIVYCKDDNRRGSYSVRRFDFLGYCFRPRSSMNRSGTLFVSFAPAVSDKAAKSMRLRMRGWQLHSRIDLKLVEVARWTQPVLLGWGRYYGRFRPSALRGALRTLDSFIVRWAQRKYKKLRTHKLRAWDWLRRLTTQRPTLFAHWTLGATAGTIGAV